MKLSEILISVQNTSATHHKYVKELEDILTNSNVDIFFNDFKKYLLIAFNKDLKIKNVYMDRFYEFCINFIDAVDSKIKITEESIFVTKIFDFILYCLELVSTEIRYHACLFIYKYILYLVKKDKTIKEDLYEKIVTSVLDTLEDANPQIRVMSVNILKLIQDPENCFSTNLIENLDDTNGKVRAAIIDALIPSVNNLSHIINRCRDIDENVRTVVFKKVANIPVQSFTIEQRQYLLKCGLKDRSERIKKCVNTIMLPAWLKYYQCDYIKFLKALQLDSNKKEIDDTKLVSDLMLKSLFSTRPIQEILEALFLEKKLIPLDQLTWESALFWKCLINHLQTKKLEQYWELILPETVLFCEYIEKFCATTKLLNASIWEEQLYLLIFHELLYILLGCDITDEASRRKMYSLLVSTLKDRKIDQEIVEDIVKYFQILMPNTDRRINFFCELISDIRTPLTTKSVELMNENEEKKRELNKKLKQLLAEKAQTIQNQEFQKTKQINVDITATKELLQTLDETANTSNEEEDQEKINDPVVVSKCLDIALALLKTSNINIMHPALISLKKEIFMEIMTCKDTCLQGKYFRCYGIICSLDKTIVMENIQFFCLPLTLYSKDKSGEIEIVTAAIDVIGDLILIHGTKILPMYDGQEDPNKSFDFELMYGNSEMTLNEYIDILSLMLDDTNIEIRESACEVLTKLMLTRRIESPELFSRLFLKWLSPTSASNIKFRQTLGIFIEMFCQLEDIEQQLEESIIPIIKTISYAPRTSPLSNVSKDELLKTIIKIINLRHDEDYTIHENLAMKICVEIQNDISSKCVSLLVRALLYLELYRDDTCYIEKLLNISEDILFELKDKTTHKNMKKFILSLKYD